MGHFMSHAGRPRGHVRVHGVGCAAGCGRHHRRRAQRARRGRAGLRITLRVGADERSHPSVSQSVGLERYSQIPVLERGIAREVVTGRGSITPHRRSDHTALELGRKPAEIGKWAGMVEEQPRGGADRSKLFNTDPGGRPPNRRDVAAAVSAVGPFSIARDVPDVLGFADYAVDPELTYQLVRDRVDRCSVFADQRPFPLPKPNGAGMRGITVAHPLDELLMRVYVGRCSASLKAAVLDDRVFNGLFTKTGPGWISAEFREQNLARRARQRELYDAPTTAGIGLFDVKRFFPTCRHDVLRDLLLKTGAPSGAVATVIALLGSIYDSGVGLPIGLEGSAPLSNLFLGSLDAALVQAGLPSVRWTDDLDVFLADMAEASIVRELVDTELERVGLSVNPDKVEVLEKGPIAEDRLLDPSRDSLFDADATKNVAEMFEFLQVMSRMTRLGSSARTDDGIPPAHMRSYLGLLAKEQHPAALDHLVANPRWVDEEPRSVGSYLEALGQSRSARGKVDPDWLLDLAVRRPPTKETAAGQLHLCRALAGFKLDKTRAAEVLDFATTASVVAGFPALGGWAVRAWAAGQGWKPDKAVELVDGWAPIAYRRAALSGFVDRKAGAAPQLRKAVQRHPELRPVASLAASV